MPRRVSKETVSTNVAFLTTNPLLEKKVPDMCVLIYRYERAYFNATPNLKNLEGNENLSLSIENRSSFGVQLLKKISTFVRPNNSMVY